MLTLFSQTIAIVLKVLQENYTSKRAPNKLTETQAFVGKLTVPIMGGFVKKTDFKGKKELIYSWD